MSRKSKSRLSKKQIRKDRRKTKRNLRKMQHAGKNRRIPDAINMDANDQLQVGRFNDERPSTSRKKQLSPKRSPWRNKGGTVNRFNKIREDLHQTKRVVKRTVYIVKDNQTTPAKVSVQKSANNPPLNNKRKNDIRNRINKNVRRHKVSYSLEEGEIRSDADRSLASTATDTLTHGEEDNDDDCMVIEPTYEEITIDDIDDDNIPSTSDYHSLIGSFKECSSSTPCHRRKSPSLLYAKTVNTPDNNNTTCKTECDDILPFFVDVGPGRGTESINSTDNFTDYIKLSILDEKSPSKRRSVRLDRSVGLKEVIELDDTSNDSADITLKHKSREVVCDDSVMFVSETNKNDFISIVDDKLPPHKFYKKSDPVPKSPANRLRTNNLFTHSETKQLNKYNENAYFPSNDIELTTGKRVVIIDGNNVAFKHGLDQIFSVKGIKIAIDYFEKLGHEVKTVIPQFRMNRTKSTDYEELNKLHKAGKIVQTPCKNIPGHTSISYDDRFILQLAFAMDAAVVSNDNYRDLLHETPAFKKIIENRVIGFTWCNDIFILPKDPYGKWGPTLHTILNRT